MHNNPFPNIKLGLQHGSYNTPARDYRPVGEAREIETVDRNPYKYKYQGQERQDELGLNWDSFKWRNYDYALGRFMSVDPLAEDYSYQSPYNFSENRVVDGRELEGLEFKSVVKKENHNTYHFPSKTPSVSSSYSSRNTQVKLSPSNFIKNIGKALQVPILQDRKNVTSNIIETSYQYYDSDGNEVDTKSQASSLIEHKVTKSYFTETSGPFNIPMFSGNDDKVTVLAETEKYTDFEIDEKGDINELGSNMNSNVMVVNTNDADIVPYIHKKAVTEARSENLKNTGKAILNYQNQTIKNNNSQWPTPSNRYKIPDGL